MDRSPEEWVDLLWARLEQRLPRYERLHAYASGDHPIPPAADDKWAKHYRRWLQRSRTNLCGLVAASVSERMRVEGFRSTDGVPDRDVWAWWQAAHLDADSDLVHATAANLGDAYVVVGQDAITVETPMQCIADIDPQDSRHVRAFLKTWVDHDVAHARLILPGVVHRFESPITPVWVEGLQRATRTRQWRPAGSQPSLDVVPAVRFTNRPQLHAESLAEFEDAIDIQDRINTITLHLLTIGASQAFRQLIVKGLPTEDEDGNPIDPPFEALVSAMWSVEDLDVEFQQLEQVDLSPLLASRKAAAIDFITVTGLPPHYTSGDLVNASADAILAAETRLVAKVRARQRCVGESWEQVMRIRGQWAGVTVPDDLEVTWADPERKSSAALSDAAAKDASWGMPFPELLRSVGKSQQEVERIVAEAEAEQAAKLATATTATMAALTTGVDGGDEDSAAS